MPSDMLFVFGLLAVTIVLFVSDRVRLDVVAVMVMLALALSGVLTPAETFAGFGATVVILIAGLFVVGEGLLHTGVAAGIGNLLLRLGGGSETRMLLFLMPAVAGLSAFMSSTGAVAIFIPVVLSLARRSGLKPGRLLMPLAFASLIGGMMTLIGTPPNVVASAQLERSGFAPFGFFEFTPIGGAVLIIGILYMILVGRRFLPGSSDTDETDTGESLAELAARYAMADRMVRLRVGGRSGLVGKTVGEAGLRSQFEVTVIGAERHGRFAHSILPVLAETRLRVGDVLYAIGSEIHTQRLCAAQGLENLGVPQEKVREYGARFGLAEVMVTPRSRLIGRTLKGVLFRKRFGLSVLAVRRKEKAPLPEAFTTTRFEFGDTLLIAGGWSQIEAIRKEHHDFLVLGLPSEAAEVPPAAQRAPFAVMIMLAMLVAMTLNLASGAITVLIAALAMVLTRCVTVEGVYRSMNWQSIVLIAGMLPVSTALKKTGGAQLIVDWLVGSVGAMGPMSLLTGLFVLTSVFSQFISNTATTVLVAPIAMAAAQQMGISPYPLLMGVAIAASTAFATPVASPVNTLVLGPGNYRFMDFVKVGVPLQVVAMALTLALVPVFFPF